ncbi:MAG: ATP-binding protein [Bacteroidetes bacterium]|nr:ATP-binding protein [Bacteroidota bacterium]
MSDFMHPDASHRSNIFSDRGVARYFHGRTQIRYDFNDLLRLALTREDARTSMLIQGAPGAGETALLEEMALDALEKRWGIVEINFDDLYNRAHVAQTLGKPYVSSKQISFKGDIIG